MRQLRLRDIGGIIVVDFIDMVLESNRDLVVRRLVECLGRDRTRHQVAEVTSLGLVQMTRKRIGTGLVETFSENCEHCHGRGVVIKDQPVDPKAMADDSGGYGRRSSGRRGRRGANDDNGGAAGTPVEPPAPPSPKDVAAMARHDKQVEDAAEAATEDASAETAPEAVADAPAETVAETVAQTVAETADDTAVEPAPEPAPEPAVEAVDEAPADAEAPRVVTRTRRRSASRPAGPPSAVPATSGAGTVPASGVVEPGTVDVEPGVDPGAGPGAESGVDAPIVEHVPIKKKGSRKR